MLVAARLHCAHAALAPACHAAAPGKQVGKRERTSEYKGQSKLPVLKSPNTSAAVWAQPLPAVLAWHCLPATRFLGTPVGAGAALRKRLAHMDDVFLWRGQAGRGGGGRDAHPHEMLQPGGVLAGCGRLQHLQLPLPAHLPLRCSADGPRGCQVELHADCSQLLRPWLLCLRAGAGAQCKPRAGCHRLPQQAALLCCQCTVPQPRCSQHPVRPQRSLAAFCQHDCFRRALPHAQKPLQIARVERVCCTADAAMPWCSLCC